MCVTAPSSQKLFCGALRSSHDVIAALFAWVAVNGRQNRVEIYVIELPNQG